jgi:hypothetical protein
VPSRVEACIPLAATIVSISQGRASVNTRTNHSGSTTIATRNPTTSPVAIQRSREPPSWPLIVSPLPEASTIRSLSPGLPQR